MACTVAGAAFSLLWLAFGARAGVSLPDASERAPELKARPRSEPTYQVRCWQYGRLLFEENDVQLPPDLAEGGLKLRGTDRDRLPVYVAETRNATCLIRSARPDRDRSFVR